MSSGERILSALSAEPGSSSVISNADNSVILTRSFFAAREGRMQPGSYLKLGLCMAGGGELVYGAGEKVQLWQCNDIFLNAPEDNSLFKSPDIEMIGLAIDLKKRVVSEENLACFYQINSSQINSSQIISSQVMSDKVIQSVLIALWTCAEYHGQQSAFIDEGIEIILTRLSQGIHKKPSSKSRALSERQLNDITDYVQNHLCEDIRVPKLAAQLGMEQQQFSRALRAATGCAPYAYLLSLRMENAKRKLDAGDAIIDTALAVGYTNPSKFAAAFKRTVGCNPSQWKKRACTKGSIPQSAF